MSEQAIIFENMPYNLFLMQRLEFVVICGDHLAANVMRIVEAEMIKLKEGWQARVEKALEEKKTPPNEPKAYWVRLSLSQIIARLYMYDSGKLKKPESEDMDSPEWVEYRMKKALSISKGTLRKAIDQLKSLGFLLERSKPGDEFGAPIWTLHKENVQKALKTLPQNPFTIFHALGGGSKFEYGGEVQNLNVPPTNFECGEMQNLNVPGSENEGGEVQNLEVDIDIEIDSPEDSEIDNDKEGTDGADRAAPAPVTSDSPTEGHDGLPTPDSHSGDQRLSDPALGTGRHLADTRRDQETTTTAGQATSEVAPGSGGYEKASELSTSVFHSVEKSAHVEPKVVDVRTLTLKAHTNYVFQWLDEIRRECSEDPLASYVQSGASEKKVSDLIHACMNTTNELTKENVQMAWKAMWTAGKWENGKSWQDPGMLTIKAYTENYGGYLDRARAALAKERSKASKRATAPTVSGLPRWTPPAYVN